MRIEPYRRPLREIASDKVRELARIDAFLAQMLQHSADASRPDAVPKPTAKQAVLVVGCKLVIGTGLEHALSKGWHNPEDWGVWSARPDALIRLHTTRRPDLPIRLRLSFVSGPAGQVRLGTIAVAGHETGQFEVPPDMREFDITFVLKPALVDESGLVELQVGVSQLCKAGSNGDPRELGVGLREITATDFLGAAPPAAEPSPPSLLPALAAAQPPTLVAQTSASAGDTMPVPPRSFRPPGFREKISLLLGDSIRFRRAVTLANEAHSAGAFEAAALHFSQALNFAPQRHDLWTQLGNMYKEAGKLASADFAYRRALSIRADDPEVFVRLGHLRDLQGDEAGSIALLEQARSLARTKG